MRRRVCSLLVLVFVLLAVPGCSEKAVPGKVPVTSTKPFKVGKAVSSPPPKVPK